MTLGRFHIHVKIVCAFCGSDQTYMRKCTWTTRDGAKHETLVPHWCYGPNRERICHNCRLKFVDNPNLPKEVRKAQNEKIILYKDKRLTVQQPPRIGVCNWCRAVKEEINGQTGKLCRVTQMNHEQYHDDAPLKDAIELCVPCHRRYHNELIWITKDKQCFACYHTWPDYKFYFYFNEPTTHVLCLQCNVEIIRKHYANG